MEPDNARMQDEERALRKQLADAVKDFNAVLVATEGWLIQGDVDAALTVIRGARKHLPRKRATAANTARVREYPPNRKAQHGT